MKTKQHITDNAKILKTNKIFSSTLQNHVFLDQIPAFIYQLVI